MLKEFSSYLSTPPPAKHITCASSFIEQARAFKGLLSSLTWTVFLAVFFHVLSLQANEGAPAATQAEHLRFSKVDSFTSASPFSTQEKVADNKRQVSERITIRSLIHRKSPSDVFTLRLNWMFRYLAFLACLGLAIDAKTLRFKGGKCRPNEKGNRM